jgi:signal transduction histidine kinase
MAFPAIRARIAPIALLVAFVFVIAGFLRADREMTNAEIDRASLVASEAATVVQLFLLEHIAELHVAERVASLAYSNAGPRPDSVLARWNRNARYAKYFDDLALTDSSRTVIASTSTRSGSALILSTGSRISGAATVLREGSPSDGELMVLVSARRREPAIVFVESLHLTPNIFVAASTTTDSLATRLRRKPRTQSYELIIRAGSDTLLQLSSPGVTKLSRSVKQEVVTPLAVRWTLEMRYAPTGRGVRIALWVVGLGAIVGLGIGLLLERREASRIADRSSELEHLSTELLRANRAKSEFLANVSHELRTPLNAIVGFVDLLRDGVYGTLNSRQVGPVERIEASANHLRHLVDQVLDLAKMAAGRLEVHAEPLELRPFVFDVASEVEPLVTEKGLSFSLAVGASLPRVRTDATHLRQILINLLGNAVKFTNNGGISVRGKLIGVQEPVGIAQTVINTATQLARTPRPDGFWIALQVADSGMGIPDKDRERIFDEFEQVNAGPRGDSMRRGTGLGLSISRRLARLLGGDITVESELGRGSVFTVWLPVDPADIRGDQAA